MTTIMDGKGVAANLRATLAQQVAALRDEHGWTPRLDAVLVGDDAASHVYVRKKREACAEVGIESVLHELPAETTQDELLALMHKLNADDDCDGILVQLPLPEHIHEPTVVEAVDPAKDADGFHPINLGRLLSEQATLAPATPAGILHLLETYDVPLSGAEVVIIGRSVTVGKPMAALLYRKGVDATVTIAHSRTRDLAEVARRADVLIVAVGHARLVKRDWVKPGAVVVDVGINRVDGTLVGDVDFDAVKDVASMITPVPGGVGPLTVASLLANVVTIASKRRES